MDSLPFPDTLKEFLHFGEETAFRSKVHRVYKLCMRCGRFSLAVKIKEKHKRYFAVNCDRVASFGMALMAAKKELETKGFNGTSNPNKDLI